MHSPQRSVPTTDKDADLFSGLAAELASAASPARALALQRYFLSPVEALGVPNGEVAQIARRALARHPGIEPRAWLALAGRFAADGRWHEHLILASALAAGIARKLDDDAALFEAVGNWIDCHVSNWAQCDDLCIKPLYVCLQRRPDLQNELTAWGGSPSAWLRRASNVGLVKFVGRSPDTDLRYVLMNCERLLGDPDPYVQKAIGWMLKVASVHALPAVRDFLQQHGKRMNRATLRYAVEKMDLPLRRTLSGLPSQDA